jgi:L,D-peptidoglycan transpeptidase YkuD (ErfK/YbiS/YcfS/YnhG family)
MVPAEDKVEGDGCTPKGIYSLGIVFGSQPAVKTTMSYREIKADDYWIDDPASPDYNRWVSGKLPNVSFEQMLRQDGLYRYGVVIEYNTQPVVAGKGSAIFMHIWKAPGEPTSGCVALAETDLLQVITWLTPEKHPVIIMEDGLAG